MQRTRLSRNCGSAVITAPIGEKKITGNSARAHDASISPPVGRTRWKLCTTGQCQGWKQQDVLSFLQAFRTVDAKFADSILLIKSDGDQTEAVTLTKTRQVRSRTSRDGVRTSGSGGPAPADQTVLKIITRLPENVVKVWSRTMKKSNKTAKKRLED
jgi:hypothetical protein